MSARMLAAAAGAAVVMRAPDAGDGGGGGGGGGGGAGDGGLAVANATRLATEAERKRVSAIRARSLGFAGDAGVVKLADACIEDGRTADQFAAAALDILAKDAAPTGHVAGAGEQKGTGASVTIAQDARDKSRAGMTAALIMREQPGHVALIREGGPKADQVARAYGFDGAADAMRQFNAAAGNGMRGRSLAMMAASCAVAAGISPSFEQALGSLGDSNRFMAMAGHHSSDFPLILANVANKGMLAIFAEQETMWPKVCRRATSVDYKERQMLSLSDTSDVQELEEGDTPREATWNERKEGITVKARGLRWAFTYQMMRNDDMGAFTNFSNLIGLSFRRAPDVALITLLELNSATGPTMGDGVVQFHSTHGNVLTSAALGYEALRTAWTTFRSRRGFGPSRAYIELMPKVLIVPTALELAAIDLVTQEMAPSVASGAASASASQQRNTMRGLLSVAASPRFASSTRWYLTTGPGPFAAWEMAFLDGVETPQVDRIGDGDPMNIRYQATQLGFGVAAANYEGAATNAGT